MTSRTLQTMDDLCAVLKVLGKKNRLKIATHLLKGETSVSEIETALSIKQPNLSHELKIMREAGLVSTRRESKVIHYSLADSTVSVFISGLINLTSLKSEGNDIEIQFDSVLPLVPTGQAKPLTNNNGECGSFPRIARVA